MRICIFEYPLPLLANGISNPVFYCTLMISFENLINNLGEAVVLFDKDGRLVFANKAGEEFLGKGLREIRNKRFKDLFYGSGDLGNLLKKTLKEGRAFNGREMEVDIGRITTVDLKLAPFYTDAGLEGALLSLSENHDLSGGVNYQFDSLLYLIGSISHEIRNPLSGIRGAAQILKETVRSLEDLECINLILKETDRLNSVLLDYLTMTRKPVLNPVNIHEVLEHALKVMGPSIKDKGIQTEKLYDPSLPTISGDESKLLQVFINLFKNALESMGKGKNVKLLTVSTGLSQDYMVIYNKRGPHREETRKQRRLAVGIQDTGAGIRKNELHRIFLPFYTRKEGGSGLGLALSQKIVKDHGGIIKVRSEPGKGTAFNVYLPL